MVFFVGARATFQLKVDFLNFPNLFWNFFRSLKRPILWGIFNSKCGQENREFRSKLYHLTSLIWQFFVKKSHFTRWGTSLVVFEIWKSGCYRDGKAPKCITFSKCWWLSNDFEITPKPYVFFWVSNPNNGLMRAFSCDKKSLATN